jgi:hypothetical protein
MVKPTQDWQGEHASYPLRVARNRRPPGSRCAPVTTFPTKVRRTGDLFPNDDATERREQWVADNRARAAASSRIHLARPPSRHSAAAALARSRHDGSALPRSATRVPKSHGRKPQRLNGGYARTSPPITFAMHRNAPTTNAIQRSLNSTQRGRCHKVKKPGVWF